MDVFTIAVITGAAVLIVVFLLLIIIDKGKPASPQVTSPAKSGKR